MNFALTFIILASLLFVAVSFADPNTCFEDKKCCDPLPGRDGRDGRNGRDGLDGRNGQNGINGTDGTDGQMGVEARSEYGELFNMATVSINGGGLIPFDSIGGLSAGVTQTAANSLTVTKAGYYLVSFYIAAPSGGSSNPARLRVNGTPLTTPQYSFLVGGSDSGANRMTAIVHLAAGQTIDFIIVGSIANIPSFITAPNINLNIMSLKFD